MIKNNKKVIKFLNLMTFKIIKYIIIQKIHKRNNIKKIIKIKSKKTGINPFYIRPYTTDLIILKKI